MPLLPIREHYLKRELLRAQLDWEVEKLGDFSNLNGLGYPFLPLEDSHQLPQLPFLGFIFKKHVITFPFLSDVDHEQFWNGTVRSFANTFVEIALSDSTSRSEETKRRQIGMKIRQLLLLYGASALKTTDPEESTAKVERTSLVGVQLDKSGHKFGEIGSTKSSQNEPGNNQSVEPLSVCETSVVGVRLVEEKSMVPFKKAVAHPEYIVKSYLKGIHAPTYVFRKYSDFVSLAAELRIEFPGLNIPSAPRKMKVGTAYASDDDAVHSNEMASVSSSNSGFEAREKEGTQRDHVIPFEKQRMSLRAFLKNLVSVDDQIQSSRSFFEFFYKGAESLNPSDEIDIKRRFEADRTRERNQHLFFQLAAERSKQLDKFLFQFKEDLIQADGLKKVFNDIKQFDDVSKFSLRFQKFIEWCLIEVASSLYYLFVARDESFEFFIKYRKMHRIFPYSLAKGVLRLGNPMAIMKGMLDLFLAQPFGRRSLLQNLFHLVMSEDIKGYETAIVEIKDQIPIHQVVNPIREYVKSKRFGNVQGECDEILNDIVQSSDSIPEQVKAIFATWYEQYVQVPIDRREATNYGKCKQLYLLCVRQNDAYKYQQLWDNKATIDLLKELITVFYGPILRAFGGARLWEALGDLEDFQNDLIDLVEQCDTKFVSGPNEMVHMFIKLCEKHLNSLFRFLHRIYQNDEGLFEKFMSWLSEIIQVLRQDTLKPLDIKAIYNSCESVGICNQQIDAEIDAIISWVIRRREFVEKATAHESDSEVSKMSFAKLKISDFGINPDDVNDLNEEIDISTLERPDVPCTRKLRGKFQDELVKALSLAYRE